MNRCKVMRRMREASVFLRSPGAGVAAVARNTFQIAHLSVSFLPFAISLCPFNSLTLSHADVRLRGYARFRQAVRELHAARGKSLAPRELVQIWTCPSGYVHMRCERACHYKLFRERHLLALGAVAMRAYPADRTPRRKRPPGAGTRKMILCDACFGTANSCYLTERE